MLKGAEGYVYVYKVIVGNSHDFVKIGVSNDYIGRMQQHVRTPYQGFLCFLNFLTCEPIVTAFEVTNMGLCDDLVQEHFKKYQLGDIEVYNINYNEAIKELYTLLNANNQFQGQGLIEDRITDYSFLSEQPSNKDCTDKSVFEAVRDMILAKYDELPSQALTHLRDAKDFETNCSSHYRSGNYIHFTTDLVLDLHSSKAKRFDLLCQLRDLL